MGITNETMLNSEGWRQINAEKCGRERWWKKNEAVKVPAPEAIKWNVRCTLLSQLIPICCRSPSNCLKPEKKQISDIFLLSFKFRREWVLLCISQASVIYLSSLYKVGAGGFKKCLALKSFLRTFWSTLFCVVACFYFKQRK